MRRNTVNEAGNDGVSITVALPERDAALSGLNVISKERKMGDSLHLTATDTWEDCATFTKVRGERPLAVSVSEDKAVDSYNVSFECTLHLTPAQIIELRDWINQNFSE